MANHNFENRIIGSFFDDIDETDLTTKQKRQIKKSRVYLTLIALCMAFFGLILILRGLLLFNPLAFETPDSGYDIGANKPLNFKSINVSLAEFPSSYPKTLQRVHNPEGIYFLASSKDTSIISFWGSDLNFYKTVSVNGRVRQILPLSNGNYYLAYIETQNETYISLLSYEGDSVIVKEFENKVIIQNLFYDENESIFIFSYLNNNGIYVLEGISVEGQKFEFYRGSIDEGSKIVNFINNKFYFYNSNECQKLSLESKTLVKFECKNILQKNGESKVIFTKILEGQKAIFTYDQNSGQEEELYKVPRSSIINKMGDLLISYSSGDGLAEYNLSNKVLTNVSQPFSPYTIGESFKLGNNYFLKSQITNLLYKFKDSQTVISAPISYVSYPQSEKLELQSSINGLNLSIFDDFVVYLPDIIYTL